MHALVRIVLQALRLGTKPARPAAPAEAATASDILFEQSFVTEREAREFAAAQVAQGYRAEVQQDVYDYCWSVEVSER